jgi:hypothetical protein
MGKYLEALNLFYKLNFDNDVIEINEMLYRIEMDEKKGMNVYVDNPKDLSYTREVIKNHFFDMVDEFAKYLPQENKPGPSLYYHLTQLINIYTDISAHEVYLNDKDRMEILSLLDKINKIDIVEDFIKLKMVGDAHLKDIYFEDVEGIRIVIEMDCEELLIKAEYDTDFQNFDVENDNHRVELYSAFENDSFYEDFKKPYQDVMTYVWELKNVCDKGYMWVDAKIKLNDPNGLRVL